MLKYNPKERISCLEVLQHEFFTLYGCRSKRKGQPDKLSSLGKKGTDFGSKPDIATFRITDTDSDGRVAIYDHPFSYTMINRSATPISNLQLLAEVIITKFPLCFYYRINDRTLCYTVPI